MQHEKTTNQITDSINQVKGQINSNFDKADPKIEVISNEVEKSSESLSASDIGMQISDAIISSGLVEQYGPELGISGAVIVALIGIYWKYRKGESFTKEDVQAVISAFTEDKKPAESEKTENKEAPEEVENLKKIEEESENKTEKA